MRIPQVDLAAPHRELGEEIRAAFARLVETSAFVGGLEVAGFESEFASYLGVRHCVGVGNGTDALEIALQALGIGAGDAVLTVPFSFAASIEAIVRVGATPILADIGNDFTLDPQAAERALDGRRARAILPVHLYGQPADMEGILALARRHGAFVVEDAAQAHGAWCQVGGERRRAGSLGDVACFSFYPTKNLGAMGDGGAVVTSDDAIAERVRLIANHGDRAKYEHVLADGRNSRLDALQAAVLRLKLPRLDAWNARRRAAAARYSSLLDGLPLALPRERSGSECVYHQYAVRVRDRDAVRAALAERGIGTAVHYPRALHEQDGFRHLGPWRNAFPVAERAAAEVLSLPMHPHLGAGAQEEVAAALRDILASRPAA